MAFLNQSWSCQAGLVRFSNLMQFPFHLEGYGGLDIWEFMWNPAIPRRNAWMIKDLQEKLDNAA
ncbi:MAG: hypothetical protein OXH65_11905 [Paracoccaceae bacterium]|nr:hypothetical protein [Paracoccaceae bacterium]